MIKTSATLYATLTARQKRGGGGEITKKDEGVQSLVLLPLFLIKRQDLFIILWAGPPVEAFIAPKHMWAHRPAKWNLVLSQNIDLNVQMHLHKNTTAGGLVLQPRRYLLWHL